jgi:hypothetical protein
LILAAVDGEPVHLGGVCGFELQEPGQLCAHCALMDEEDGVRIADARGVADRVERWLWGEEGTRNAKRTMRDGSVKAMEKLFWKVYIP